MAQRLAAFALALVVAAAPAAAELCDAVCARHAHHSGNAREIVPRSNEQHSHNSHHHSTLGGARAPAATTIRDVRHSCGPVYAAINQSRERTRVPVDGVGESPAVPSAPARIAPANAIDSRHGPPALIRTVPPLRM
jgi:hypothetical protein